MFNCKLNPQRGLTFVVFAAAAISTNTVFAFGSIGDDVDSICADAGNEMIVDTGSCFACHDDGDGGSGAGRTAVRDGLAATIEYFCPDPVVIPPEPTCTDNDGDGYDLEGNCGAADCDDSDPMINPAAQEDCSDNVDNNCNGLIDTADPAAVNCPIACTDMDGDGYNTEGGVCGAVDCDDNNAAVNPGAEEICTDGADNNCNDMIDAADAACAVPPTEPPADGDDGDDEHDGDDEERDGDDEHDGDDEEHDGDDEHDDDDESDDESDGDRGYRGSRGGRD